MGKKEQKQTSDLARESYNRTVGQTDEMRNYLQGKLPEQEKSYQETFDTAKGAYTDFTGGYGAYNPKEYEGIKAQNQKTIETGGYNPEALAALRGQTGNLAVTGGYDPAQLEAVRGGYSSLMKTGGLSDQAADAMRRQAAGVSQGIYSTLGSKLTRSQSIAGTGGAGGETAQMARQAGQGAAVATTGANAEIGKLRQQGIIAGTSGLGQLESGVAGGRRAGTEAGIGLESGVATGSRQGAAANQELASGAAQQRIAAAGGLTNLYNSDPGYVTNLVKGILDVQQSGGQLSTEQLKIMQDIAKQPGLFDKIMGTVGTLAGAAGGVMTGIGALS